MDITNKTPTVSVVMPVYNGELYLREAVESILNQTFGDFEFIIIDDGSTDSTWQILTVYAAQDARIVLHRNPQNLRLIKSLNKGLALAQGEYIARHDADDIALPERLATQVSYLQHHPQVGLLGTAYYRLYDQGRYSLHQPPFTDTEIRWRFLFDNIWPHPSLMFRRQLFKDGDPFYRDFLHAEDYELWVRLLKCTRAATLSAPLLIIRTHTDSGVSAKHRVEQSSMVRVISSEQINKLFSQRSLTQTEIEMLHRCYHLQELTKQDVAMGGELMFQLFKAFTQQPGVEIYIVNQIRRQWINRMLSHFSANRWKDLWDSGLLKSILYHDPLALVSAVGTYLPKYAARQMGQPLRINKPVQLPSLPLKDSDRVSR